VLKLSRLYLQAILGYNNFLQASSIITENNSASGMSVTEINSAVNQLNQYQNIITYR